MYYGKENNRHRSSRQSVWNFIRTFPQIEFLFQYTLRIHKVSNAENIFLSKMFFPSPIFFNNMFNKGSSKHTSLKHFIRNTSSHIPFISWITYFSFAGYSLYSKTESRISMTDEKKSDSASTQTWFEYDARIYVWECRVRHSAKCFISLILHRIFYFYS